MKIGAVVQDHIEFDAAIRPADIEYMQRSHRTLAEHQFDLADATFILHDCAFEVAVRRHDDTLGRRQRPEARQRLHIAIPPSRSEEHTSELQSLMRISYAVFCLKTNKKNRCPHMQSTPTTHTIIYYTLCR